VESGDLYLGLMAQGKRAATRLATIDGRQGRARILSEASPSHGRERSVEMAPPRGATAPVASRANRLISVRRDGVESPSAA
jgi:hypothetical protein